MWRMQSGERVLTKAEWACLAMGVDFLFDQVDFDVKYETDDAETGIPVFDRLTAEQKLLILAEVAEALVRKKVPWPDLTAVREATVAAMFESLEFIISLEVAADRPKKQRTTIRELLLAALADDPPEEMPKAKCTDESEWELMVECFADRVLWDRDFNLDQVADLPPEAAAKADESFGFGEGYFSAVAAEPNADALAKARKKLRKLIKEAG